MTAEEQSVSNFNLSGSAQGMNDLMSPLSAKSQKMQARLAKQFKENQSRVLDQKRAFVKGVDHHSANTTHHTHSQEVDCGQSDVNFGPGLPTASCIDHGNGNAQVINPNTRVF